MIRNEGKNEEITINKSLTKFITKADVILFDMGALSWVAGDRRAEPGWCRGVGGSTFNDNFHQIYVFIKYMNSDEIEW